MVGGPPQAVDDGRVSGPFSPRQASPKMLPVLRTAKRPSPFGGGGSGQVLANEGEAPSIKGQPIIPLRDCLHETHLLSPPCGGSQTLSFRQVNSRVCRSKSSSNFLPFLQRNETAVSKGIGSPSQIGSRNSSVGVAGGASHAVSVERANDNHVIL